MMLVEAGLYCGTIIGTCSLCSGPVGMPNNLTITMTATPCCFRCGAVPRNPFGPRIEMQPRFVPEVHQPLEEDAP